jgi:hypothetical protein
MDGDDERVREGVRGLDRVVRIHRQVERAAGLGGAREQQHDVDFEATRHFGDAVVPDRVAGDINRAVRLI